MGHYFLVGFFITLGVLAAAGAIFIVGGMVLGFFRALGLVIRQKLPTERK